MAITNRERVQRGLDYLRAGLIPFVERELKAQMGDLWINDVSYKMNRDLKRLPDGSYEWDTPSLLKAMMGNWRDIFGRTLGHFERSLVSELLETRNAWAHERTFSSEDTLRALDSIGRLLTAVSAHAQAKEVDKIKVELQRTVFAEQARQQTRNVPLIEGQPTSGLTPWRDVVMPHKDVATGRYVQAEFAADLAQVARGEGSDEYRNPTEFFRRTFITDGLRELLSGALLRLDGREGDPVVELQTNFGGGKTHSMLALYHLFGDTPSSSLSGMEAILKDVGVEQAPTARRAVLVGTALSPGEVSRKAGGVEVRTLWGEIAWQLGGKDAYDMVAESDAKGISPGSEALATMFSALSPCVVLIDEWVAYGRQLVGKRGLPAGDFEAQASFAQALTEAAKAADRTLVVASIPASKIEIGGEHGEYALEALRNVFERLGTPWRPASADEGFEIVRRRLFEPITDKDAFAARDAVVDAYARMYKQSSADFPSGCGEGSYRRKLEAAYPIHPELFDRLYGEWSTLDKFQRTRGVLRLLAKVIHRLWESQHGGLMIMPSSIPMDDPGVKSELTKYIPDVWEPIISSDVDGVNSLPVEIDRATPTLQRYSACRRVARTLYVGTAPGAEGKNPGIDDRAVRLGCTQPGESPATFGDALRRVSERAKHIHQDGNRYWLSTKANLNRVAEDRAADLLRQPEELHAELVRWLRKDRTRGDFRGVHVCPEGSSEVGDETEARLVILGPKFPHRKGQDESAAMAEARAVLENRGNSPRINRNTLVFLAPDVQRLEELMSAAAYYRAWQSIWDDRESLNLDSFGRRQAQTKVKDGEEAVNLRIGETWVHALVPMQADPTADITWEEIRISGQDTLAKRTSTKLKHDELLVPQMGGIRLRKDLDDYLWTDKDHVSIGQLVEWFPRYLYLPRIVSRDTLIGAVKDGAGLLLVDETFAFASGYDEDKGRYVGLQMRAAQSTVYDHGTLLVKPDVAKAQIQRDEEEEEERRRLREKQPTVTPEQTGCVDEGGGHVRLDGEPPSPEWPPPEQRKPTRFVGSVQLDGNRIGRDAGRVAEEVIQHVSTLPGAKVEVTLEIHVQVPDGIEEDVVRTVTENANTLKFNSHGFEKE